MNVHLFGAYGANRQPRWRCEPQRLPFHMLPSDDRHAAGDGISRPGDVAPLVRGEQYVDRSQLGRLASTLEGHLLSEALDLLRRHGRWNEGRPDRPRCHRICADALLSKQLGQTTREVRPSVALARRRNSASPASTMIIASAMSKPPSRPPMLLSTSGTARRPSTTTRSNSILRPAPGITAT